MAYMSQEHKKRINAELKKVVPSNWKWSLSVRHHAELVFTVWSGPRELLIGLDGEVFEDHRSPNEYYLENSFDGELLETFQKIKDCMNLDNFDNSDPMTDYFHVGHYIDIQIGRWDKPYKVIEVEPAKVEEIPEPTPEPAKTAVPATLDTKAKATQQPRQVEAEPAKSAAYVSYNDSSYLKVTW